MERVPDVDFTSPEPRPVKAMVPVAVRLPPMYELPPTERSEDGEVEPIPMLLPNMKRLEVPPIAFVPVKTGNCPAVPVYKEEVATERDCPVPIPMTEPERPRPRVAVDVATEFTAPL